MEILLAVLYRVMQSINQIIELNTFPYVIYAQWKYDIQCILKLKVLFWICKYTLKYQAKIMAMEFKNFLKKNESEGVTELLITFILKTIFWIYKKCKWKIICDLILYTLSHWK